MQCCTLEYNIVFVKKSRNGYHGFILVPREKPCEISISTHRGEYFWLEEHNYHFHMLTFYSKPFFITYNPEMGVVIEFFINKIGFVGGFKSSLHKNNGPF